MMWALPIGMAALGYLQGEKKRKQELAMAKANIEANRYSPWTGSAFSVEAPTGDGLTGAMQGGLSGAMMAQSFGGAGAQKAMPTGEATMTSDLDPRYMRKPMSYWG